MIITSLQLIQTIALLVIACALVAGLAWVIINARQNLRTANYNEIDKNYQTLLTMAMNNSFLRKPETIISQEQLEKYDIYAFMMWNFLETIYDKCLKDRQLIETWGPIIEVEGAIHIEWFQDVSNKVKFKAEFYQYIELFIESVLEFKKENNLK